MNKVRNWSIIATIFAILAFLVMLLVNRPALSWGFAAVAIVATCIAFIRYEDAKRVLGHL